jgi:hypothetical protein
MAGKGIEPRPPTWQAATLTAQHSTKTYMDFKLMNTKLVLKSLEATYFSPG